ncbi:DUF262 domain-containing protein [Acinetobacter baumannii]|uniref:DUF262 domain-containing protein n=1 Tax=Acinetobacter baumannii TaxID=470 RepID=UPI001914A3F3|nr:DUF262 domain-containing protein [Acinetobacter baumannii]EHU2502372.1 DUF262 domain-containing protein [Acinetobacter baumannii]MBK5980591.1 DUF262 domain-containing protein [Acinetobacter baumannii]MDV7379823.1 DUF262 domain-containing protein [Acinetobacter baumannii]MDX6036805.1 DUF262 domain-containing protein [Acinetobacter baumannii]
MISNDLITIEGSDDQNQSFDPTQINLQAEVHTIYNLITRMKHEELIAPDYQRKKEIWNSVVQSRLIESLIVRIPIPILYLDATNDDQWKIVDGLQRLTTLKKFIDYENELPFKLEGLEYVTELNGLTFNDLPRAFQRRILETQVSAVLIKNGTPENVKFNIFKRLNTGGAPLNDQEIRHALNIGSSKEILERLSKSHVIRSVIKNDISNERMELNELILRGFGYWFFTFDSIRQTTLDTYLVKVMQTLNKYDALKLEKKIIDFFSAISCADKIFGDKVFRKINGNRKNQFNKNVYETWMAVLHEYTQEERNLLIKNKEFVVQGFEELLKEKSYNYAISSRKSSSILTRTERLRNLLKEILI